MAEIVVSHLTKDYGSGRGVFDVSFSVDKGECFGFLGPNGAGKSTTIRHLMYALKPSSDFNDIYTNNSETVPADYDVTSLLTHLSAGDISTYLTSDERNTYRQDRSENSSAVFLGNNMTQPATITKLLDALSKYGVSEEKYESFGYTYASIKHTAYSTEVSFQARYDYELSEINKKKAAGDYPTEADYQAAIATMYDPSFYAKYKDIIDFEANDYACPNKDSNEFPYLRCFDTWAGHSWANGLGYFTEGNNEESSSEGLNAWVGAYLIGLADGDQSRIDAAIYGFTTEIYSVKQYWFDYDGDVWLKDLHTVGIGVCAIQWAGKYDYATWFGANPSFIYGIEWLPVGEYLTSYALGSSEIAKLKSIYGLWKTAQAESPDKAVWAANFRSVQAIFDPTSSISEFSESAILNDDYPSELSGAYWMVHDCGWRILLPSQQETRSRLIER